MLETKLWKGKKNEQKVPNNNGPSSLLGLYLVLLALYTYIQCMMVVDSFKLALPRDTSNKNQTTFDKPLSSSLCVCFSAFQRGFNGTQRFRQFFLHISLKLLTEADSSF